MSTYRYQSERENPAKPSVIKRNGVWLARVIHPTEGHLVDGSLELREAFAKAVNYSKRVAAAQAGQ